MTVGSFVLRASPAFIVIWFLDGSHSFWGKMESQYCFKLQFSVGYICWVFFHLFFVHFFFFLWEVPIHFICPYFHYVFYSWKSKFMISFYSLYISLLSKELLANISYFVHWLSLHSYVVIAGKNAFLFVKITFVDSQSYFLCSWSSVRKTFTYFYFFRNFVYFCFPVDYFCFNIQIIYLLWC